MLGVLAKCLTPVPGNGMAPDRAAAVYDRHAPGLYQQALLTLGDPGMAEQVVSDVVVAECTRFGPAEKNAAATGRRLAVAAHWRCLELTGGPARHLRAARPPAAGRAAAGPDARSRSLRERGALALVLFGGLGCHEACQQVAALPAELTIAVHAAVLRLTAAGWRAPCAHPA
jgi:hypothetical protein